MRILLKCHKLANCIQVYLGVYILTLGGSGDFIIRSNFFSLVLCNNYNQRSDDKNGENHWN